MKLAGCPCSTRCEKPSGSRKKTWPAALRRLVRGSATPTPGVVPSICHNDRRWHAENCYQGRRGEAGPGCAQIARSCLDSRGFLPDGQIYSQRSYYSRHGAIAGMGKYWTIAWLPPGKADTLWWFKVLICAEITSICIEMTRNERLAELTLSAYGINVERRIFCRFAS